MCCYAKGRAVNITPHDLRLHSSEKLAAALKVLQLDFTDFFIRSYISVSLTSSICPSPIRDSRLPSYLDAPTVYAWGVNRITFLPLYVLSTTTP